MYTATPQAPLLINLADVLSPDFVSVLTPGSGYTGGQHFFVDHKNQFVRRLSTSAVNEALSVTDEPTEDLKLALASYFLVVAQRAKGPVSMLVHPSHTTDLQETYGGFVAALSSQWRQLLQLPGEDREELVDRYFRKAYDDLVAGGAAMRSLEDLLVAVPHWIGATQVRVVNSGTPADSDIRWNTAPSWILVGGNKLDRGFTVEGLTTTFMPRRLGAGQVDSVQQRARFFGYKGSYADLCRAWLNGTTADAFEHYVHHEKLLREELVKVDEQGISLKDWKRLMLLDPTYKPTRKAVIDLPYFHDRIKGDSWVSVAKVPAVDVSTNIASADRLRTDHAAGVTRDERDGRDDRRNTKVLVPMEDFLEFLADWTGHPDDVALVNQMGLLLRARLDDDPSLKVEVYFMDDGELRSRTPVDGTLPLAVGHSAKYIGDAKFFTPGFTSVQLHQVRVATSEQVVVGLSVRVPASLAGAVLVQA
nr:Z1 domain-containing protein [Nocardioides perillae]